MRENKIVANNGSSIVIYTTEDGRSKVGARHGLAHSKPNGRVMS
ncbi:MAG: hypothetical protein SO162_00750 [Candidatus Onthomorpha sp.]|nr:hypothetical protein [Candidatus Onthomorpha sp.]